MSIDASRRDFLVRSGLGFGSLAAGFLLNASEVKNPLAARKPMFPATAKSVIFLFMHGGPSHLETFDPKPDAPPEIRGEHTHIATKTPGLLAN